MHIFLDEDCTVEVEFPSSKESVMRVSVGQWQAQLHSVCWNCNQRNQISLIMLSRIDGKLFM
ncbi:hypothetical protein IMY05_010G0030200 [Salix suchowensis]|nr:hypothetical protein IMY05_010G0030200 [Salix suchowensis]